MSIQVKDRKPKLPVVKQTPASAEKASQPNVLGQLRPGSMPLLRQLIVPDTLVPLFLSIAEPNTTLGLETCAFLGGTLRNGYALFLSILQYTSFNFNFLLHTGLSPALNCLWCGNWSSVWSELI